MIAMLETAETRQTVFPLSVEFYHEAGRLGLIGEDVELLEGVLFTKMPKSPLHQFIARKLQRLLQSLLPAGFFVDRECPVTCENSEPEPDLAVFAGTIEDYESHHPTTAELVIEVSINTLQRDINKAAIYAAAGVKEYWIIEPESGSLTLYQEPGATGYARQTSFTADQEARSELFPAFVVHLSTLLA